MIHRAIKDLSPAVRQGIKFRQLIPPNPVVLRLYRNTLRALNTCTVLYNLARFEDGVAVLLDGPYGSIAQPFANHIADSTDNVAAIGRDCYSRPIEPSASCSYCTGFQFTAYPSYHT